MAALFEDGSDDSIKTDETVDEEREDNTYDVERVLSERVGDDGKMHYLIKWEGYPIRDSTWEPEKHLTENVLKDWASDKAAIERGEMEAYNVDEWQKALEDYYEEIQRKKERRILKRQKRGEYVESPRASPDGSKRQDELDQPQSPKRKRTKASPIRRKGVAQPVAKRRSTALSVSDEDEATSDSGSEADGYDSLFEESIDTEPAKITKPHSKTVPSPAKQPMRRATESSAPNPRLLKQPNSKPESSKTPANSGKKATTSSAAPTTSTSAARKSAPAPVAKPAMSKRNSAPNVFNATWADNKQKRQRPRVSGQTPKDSTDPKFVNLSTQNRFQKYSKNEPPPDPSALTIVDPKTGTTHPPKTILPRNGSMDIHSAYGRRTPPPARTKSPSPPPPLAPQPAPSTRRVEAQVPLPNEGLREPVARYDNRKNIICVHWQAGTCQYTADTCPYAHVNGPSATTAKKQFTCFFWQQGGCTKTAEECHFAHWDTGISAGPPGSFRKNPLAPQLATVKAYDLNLATGSSSPTDTTFTTAKDQQSPLPQPPEHKNGPRPAPPVSDSPTFALPPHTRLTNSPIESPTSNGVEIATADPRLVGKASGTAHPPISPTKDPRLHPPVDAMAETSSVQDEPQQSMYASIEGDLQMAKSAIGTLDFNRMLAREGSSIDKVFIHMPTERANEIRLLNKTFSGLHCKVFTSETPGSWDYFRKTFAKSCLLVLHPSESFYESLPNLHNFLVETGGSGRVFSIGVQYGQCMREQREPAYEAQRLFPHGRMTFITDDVFVYYPEKATEIIERFLAKTKEKPVGGEHHKIAARPGIKDWMSWLANKKLQEQGGEDKVTDLRWIQCYNAICSLCPPEDEDPDYLPLSVPLETSNLWSDCEDHLPSFKGRWEKGDEEGATDYMANFFAGEACSKVSDYRQFVFVYQRPGAEMESLSSQGAPVVKPQADPKGWMKKYNHIGVATPDDVLESPFYNR